MDRATYILWYAVAVFMPLALGLGGLNSSGWRWVIFVAVVLGCQVAWMIAHHAYLREHPEVKRTTWRGAIVRMLPVLALLGGVFYLLSRPGLLLAVLSHVFGMLTEQQLHFVLAHPNLTSSVFGGVVAILLLLPELIRVAREP